MSIPYKKRRNYVRNQVRRGLIEALRQGYRYGKGRSMFHLPKKDILDHHTTGHSSRYRKGKLEKSWLNKGVIIMEKENGDESPIRFWLDKRIFLYPKLYI